MIKQINVSDSHLTINGKSSSTYNIKINLTKVKDTCILMLRSYLLSLVHINFYP